MTQSVQMIFDDTLVVIFEDEMSRGEVIRQLAARLEAGGYVKETFADSVLAREEIFPTGLPMEVGMAIPHTNAECVKRNALAIAVLRHPVTFEQMGAGGTYVDAYLVCMLAISDKESVVDTLSTLVATFQDSGLQHKLKEARHKADIVQLLREAMPELVVVANG